jgi:CBS domain-containing protein
MPRSETAQGVPAIPAGQPAVPPSVVVPPVPPGESPPESVQKTRLVVEALTQLGENADPKRVAEVVQAQTGVGLDPGEAAAIRDKLLKRTQTAPGPDQPPPQATRETPAGRAETDDPARPAKRVRDVMTPGVEVIRPDATLREAAAAMKTRDIGPLPVCDGGRLVGVLTDRDITVRAIAAGEDLTAVRVRDVMTLEVITCFDDQPVTEAARLMRERQVRRLPVLDRAERLVGMVSLGDLAVKTGDEGLAGSTLKAVSEPAAPRR